MDRQETGLPIKCRQIGRPASRGPLSGCRTSARPELHPKRLRVGFVHPDLGIGGAEQLVVLAAKGLTKRSTQYEKVHIITSHHDFNHCFEETRDGTLRVTVHGDWMPRSIGGRAVALCSTVRMVYLSLVLVLRRLIFGFEYDVLIADQVATVLPLLRFVSKIVLFYGHFPDQLLCVDRKGVVKRIYRFFMDNLENCCLHHSDLILVNSNFTAEVFQEQFPTLRQRDLSTLYPPVDVEALRKSVVPCIENLEKMQESFPQHLRGLRSKQFIVSLNRYEMKKEIPRAIDCFLAASNKLKQDTTRKEGLKLVIAGGFDPRIQENRVVFEMLKQYCTARGLRENTDVIFLKSVPDLVRWCLLYHAFATIYTPDNEHFGIVPVESMGVGTPVLASYSGGPRESVLDGTTGFLCSNDQNDDTQTTAKQNMLPQLSTSRPSFTDALLRLLDFSDNQYTAMQKVCRHHAASMFGLESFSEKLHEHIIRELHTKTGRRPIIGSSENNN